MPSAADVVVAFRTHLWSPATAQLAAQLQRAAHGARFIVLADETNGRLNVQPFDKLSHTADFSAFGLPAFPPGQVLWYNADYPLYLLRRAFPAASHVVMAEYDVAVNIDLMRVLHAAQASGVDLIAHNICEGTKDWGWTEITRPHFPTPLHAFLPLVAISARGIDHLLRRRQSHRIKNPLKFEHWPFCESFIPSALAELPAYRTQEWRRVADTRFYTLAETLHIADPRAHHPGSIAHPVRGTAPGEDLTLYKPTEQWMGSGAGGDYPWWQVDLLTEETIAAIKLHRPAAAGPNDRAIISSSLDGKSWVIQMALGYGQPLAKPKPFIARWLRVTVMATGPVDFPRVELFGPGGAGVK